MLLFKDLLFPKFCITCAAEGAWLCKACVPQSIASENFIFTKDSELSSLDGLTAICSYGQNSISELVRILKYNYILEVVDDLNSIIIQTNFNFNWQDFVIVSVPLHPRRERERGFNQAEKIANLFAEKFDLAVNKNLQRAVYTKQQAMLSGDERRKNLNNAFVFNTCNTLPPRSVLLIDDVFTTGSTMKECAKALKTAGVQTVWGLVLAKG